MVIYSILSKMLIENSVKLACGFVPTNSQCCKTHFVIFHSHQKKINNSLNIEIDGKPINQQASVKYPGILIDCHLNWKEQIQQISKKYT